MTKVLNIFLVLVMIICTIGFLGGCDQNSDNKNEITDMAGVKINIPDNITKVICTSQNAVEFMVAMGLEDKLIGVHRSVLSHAWSAEYIKNINNIKGYGYSPAAEAIYESGAELVIVNNADTAEELRSVGILAITFIYGNSNEMIKAIKMLGSIFGGEAKIFAERWIECYEDTVKYLRSKLSNINDKDKVKTYFIDASGALDAGGLTTTVGGNHIVAEWFDIIGENYNNISNINEEEILEINPDLIMIGGWCENARKEQLLNDVKWVDISAVKNGNVYLSPVGFVSFERYAVEAPILLMYSASIMYPEIIEYDTINEFQKFFDEYFEIEVSEEKINYMLLGLSPNGERMD